MNSTTPQSHVLLIDDSQTMLDVMRDVLEAVGYRVSVSLETLDVDRIKPLQPDLIVQEILFAGTQETGWELLTLVQLDADLSRVPMILCTAAVDIVHDPGMAQNLDHLGIGVVLKPFTADDLLRAVADALTAQRLLDQALVA